jgi:ABC-type phosphate transport system substrate-binding protein
MKILKGLSFLPILVLSAALVQSSPAQTLQVLTAGSSAQFGPFAVAAWQLARAGNVAAFHYTLKPSAPCPGSTCYVWINDSRTVSGHTIPQEPGNLWVVWSTNGIWAYLSVDSTVGVRAVAAVPRAKLTMVAQASLPAAAATKFTYWPDGGANDTAMTTAVYTALNNASIMAGNTDIRPEDALYATNRALNTLGYGSVADPRSGHSGQFLIGNPIKSHFSGAIANPVSFAIGGGADPMSGTVGPALVTIPIGAAPIVFVASTATGSTVAAATNITSANAASLFSGVGNCAAALVTGATGIIDPVLREPLSGTMNTTEFTVFRPGSPSGGTSQETGISATTDNPLQKACGTGFRYRGVGTGDVVNNVIATPNTLGYAFFSYEGTASGKTDRYLKLNSIDGISGTYSSGALPACPVVNGAFSCPIANGKSFPTLRNGTYPAWSIYRIVTDSTHQANVQRLVTQAQLSVNANVPNFVPFTPVCGTAVGTTNDPGLAVWREHYVPSTITTIPDTISITPNDGSKGASVICKVVKGTYPSLTYGGGTEAGGDVGGLIQVNPASPLTEGQPH